MKNFSHSININKGDNYLFNHTECDWSAMRINSLINIDNDPNFYVIGNIEPFNYIVDFTVENDDLVVNGNIENYLILDDIITVSYKEYETLAIKSFINNGSGYKVGDILSCSGGTTSLNIIDNTSQGAIFKVEEADSNGKVTKLNIINKGLYITSPDTNNKLIGGNGQNIEVNLEFIVNPNRKMVEKQVLSAINSGPNTIIEVYGGVPKEVISGKLSLSKYKAYLISNYVGESKRNVSYHINRDNSPHLGLPLLVKNSNKSEEFYNHTILMLDRKLKELQDRIDKLENR